MTKIIRHLSISLSILIATNIYSSESINYDKNFQHKINNPNKEIFKKGYLTFAEKKLFYIYKEKLGPFKCSEIIKDKYITDCDQKKIKEVWLNLKTGKYEFIKKIKTTKPSIVFNDSLSINFFNSVAIVSFELNFLSFTKLENDFKLNHREINCLSDGYIVFDIYENNNFNILDDIDNQDNYLMTFINNKNYPYILRYIDDDQYWNNKSKFNTGRYIYIFLGAQELQIISKVGDLVCTFNHLINKKISMKKIHYGYR